MHVNHGRTYKDNQCKEGNQESTDSARSDRELSNTDMVRTKRWLYLDDIRIPRSPHFDLVRTYEQFKEYIESQGVPDLISFDHDLHDEHIKHYHNHNGRLNEDDYESFKYKTGLDCCKFLVEYCEARGIRPGKVWIHSHNRSGALNIRSYLTSWYRSKDIPESQWDVWFFEPPYDIAPETPW